MLLSEAQEESDYACIFDGEVSYMAECFRGTVPDVESNLVAWRKSSQPLIDQNASSEAPGRTHIF